MLKAGFFILALLCCPLCHAQCDSTNYKTSRHLNIKLSYYSTVIYPGLSTGIEFPLQSTNVQVSKNHRIVRCFTRERFISAALNWYHHPAFHNNLYLTAEWVIRRTSLKGLISEVSIGPGYSRTFLAGTTYRVDDKGNISVVNLAGYNYALITIGGGFGYDFSLKKRLPFSTCAKMNIISMFPYNSTIYFRPVLELGIRYSPAISKNKISK